MSGLCLFGGLPTTTVVPPRLRFGGDFIVPTPAKRSYLTQSQFYAFRASVRSHDVHFASAERSCQCSAACSKSQPLQLRLCQPFVTRQDGPIYGVCSSISSHARRSGSDLSTEISITCQSGSHHTLAQAPFSGAGAKHPAHPGPAQRQVAVPGWE